MKTFIAFTLLAALIVLAYGAEKETTVMFRNFHENEICEDKKDDTEEWQGTTRPTPLKNEKRVTHIFRDIRDECQSHNDFVFTKEECTENGWTLHLCLDKECNECVAKTFGWQDCIGDNIQAVCINKDTVGDWVELNEAVIRLSIHGTDADADEVKCDDENLETWGFFRPNTCETLMGAYFKIIIEEQEGNKNAKIQFFDDNECSEEKVLKYEGVDSFPLPTDKCLRSVFIDSKKAFQISLNARE